MPTITVSDINVRGLRVDVTCSGLTPGTRYDIYRLSVILDGEDDNGHPTYGPRLPDRRNYWRTVGHRYGWEAPAAETTFRDYEAPMGPFRYFVVETAAEGPHDYDWAAGDYPLERGTLSGDVVHLAHLEETTLDEYGDPLVDAEDRPGSLILRSTATLGLYSRACLYDLDDIRYTARGTEHAVMGRQYPLYVADTREARRGRMTMITRDIADYDEVRDIVFPQNGRIAPVMVNAGSDNTLLLDDMMVIPLDISVQQASPHSTQVRFITLDFVEIDPTTPLIQRSGDNPDPAKPVAGFTVSPRNPSRSQQVTFTDTSSGSITTWKWDLRPATGWSGQSGPGPYRVRYTNQRTFKAKLRVQGPAGADVAEKTIRVR